MKTKIPIGSHKKITIIEIIDEYPELSTSPLLFIASNTNRPIKIYEIKSKDP